MSSGDGPTPPSEHWVDSGDGESTSGHGWAIGAIVVVGLVAVVAIIVGVTAIVRSGAGSDDAATATSPTVATPNVTPNTIPDSDDPDIDDPDIDGANADLTEIEELDVEDALDLDGLDLDGLDLDGLDLDGLDELFAQLDGLDLDGLDLDDLFAQLDEVLGGLDVDLPEIPEIGGSPAVGGAAIAMFEPGGARAVVGLLADAVGTAEPNLVRVVLYPDRAIAQAQDPDVADHVDEYRYARGSISDPSPVRLTGSRDLDEQLYSSSEVDWDVVAAVVAAAPDLAEIADGDVTHVVVERPLPFSHDVRMRVFVVGPRSSGYVDANADGVVIDITAG